MASPTLETARRAHEDIERALHLSAEALGWSHGLSAPRLEACGAARPSRARDVEYLARELVECARARSAQLLDLYKDDGMLSEETASLASAETRAGNDHLSSFYSRLRELKYTHTLSGVAALEAPDEKLADAALLDLLPKMTEFSGEEGFGKYLDLHGHYLCYINLFSTKQSMPSKSETRQGGPLKSSTSIATGQPESTISLRSQQNIQTIGTEQAQYMSSAPWQLQRVDYVDYVKETVTKFEAVPSSVRNSSQYKRYLESLLEYLVSFSDRLHPLSEVRTLIESKRAELRNDVLSQLAVLRDRFDSPQEMLNMMNADKIRDELLALGFKCGGSPLQRATRLFEAAEAAACASENGFSSHRGTSAIESNFCDIGTRTIIERLILYICEDMLAEERRKTVTNIEKKLSLSWIELEAERMAEEAVAGTESKSVDRNGELDDLNESEKPIYNPKDIPLGWDGRPIPYWLYKLHGLNHEYRCEVCGGAVYKGPRAFERHFTDVQHVHGLRCLDVTYSKQYFMVTRIADVLKLRDKVEQISKVSTFDVDAEMEYEDSEGNVVNRKTYKDLERQGLL